MHLDHTTTLETARAHLAALADQAQTLAASSAYERVLIDLDRLHRNHAPGFDPLESDESPRALISRATRSIDALARFGIDQLDIELLLAALDSAWALDER